MLVAKLAMVELAGGMGYRQPNAAFTGPGINPWSRDAWSGGSSSGSGSAVGGGPRARSRSAPRRGARSSRPPRYCGVTGLRPTYGRVSRHGAMALCWTLDKLGPLALTADDCGLVLDAIAGPDPATRPQPAARSATRQTRPPAGRFRFGVLRGTRRDCGAAGARDLRALAGVLREIGTVEEVDARRPPVRGNHPDDPLSEAASAFEDIIESGTIAQLTAPEDRYSPTRAT